MSRTTEPALLLLDKAASLSSRKAGGQAARHLGVKKYGHLGTLDPFATGILPVMLGRATRLAQYLPQVPKGYAAEICLGASTTTDDVDGEVVETADIPSYDSDALEQAAQAFTGEIRQRPPAFSAIRVDGQRAYKRARRGEAVEVPERDVSVYELRLRGVSRDRLALDVVCGSGTYIRSLARDIGLFLGTRAHLTRLRRTRVGAWGLEDAAPLDAMPERGVIGMKEALALCGQEVHLPGEAQRYLRQGKPLANLEPLNGLPHGRYSVFCGLQAVALVESDSAGGWRYCLVLPEADHRERFLGG